jgi:hypothetical protein
MDVVNLKIGLQVVPLFIGLILTCTHSLLKLETSLEIFKVLMQSIEEEIVVGILDR